MGKLFSALGVVGFVCVMAYALSWTVRGWVTVQLWDGKSPLECYGSTVMTLKHKHAKLASGVAIQAAGNCELKLVDCEIEAPTPLTAGGNARVTVEGGTLHGTDAALSAAGDAHVQILGAKLIGPVNRGGSATVTGLPELDRKQAAQDLLNRYGRGACDGMLDCYARAEAFGQISGRVVMPVGTDGRVVRARYDRGTATDAVQKCLLETAQKKRIAGYDGKPGGALTCEYGGVYLSRSKMMSIDGRFTRE